MTTVETLAVLYSALTHSWTRDLLIDYVLNQTGDFQTDPREIRAEIDRLKHLGFVSISADGIVDTTARGRALLASDVDRLGFFFRKLADHRW